MGDSGVLYIVPTPIGNLGDMTLRSLDVLRSCDAVYAEDTRVTGKLLAHFGISKPTYRLDENMMAKSAGTVVDQVVQGKQIAYCTDAGMPGVSDPGGRLVAAAREAGVDVEVLPGSCAAITAFVACAPNTDDFYFGGFLPRKDEARKSLLIGLANLDAALIFYESPNRLVDSLKVISDVFPNRCVHICREITKLHEEIYSAKSKDAHSEFSNREDDSGIKGEIVVVIDGISKIEQELDENHRIENAKILSRKLASSGMRKKEIARELVERFSIPRNVAYEISLNADE